MAIQLRPRNFDLWIIAAAPATMFFPHFVGDFCTIAVIPDTAKKLTSERRKTMATCSPCPIRSFGLSGTPPLAYQ